jgi:hypothetical protein
MTDSIFLCSLRVDPDKRERFLQQIGGRIVVDKSSFDDISTNEVNGKANFNGTHLFLKSYIFKILNIF